MTAQNPTQPVGTDVVEAERRFFARRSSPETLISSADPHYVPVWRQVMEAVITGGILLLMALSTANSIYEAGWVAEMPDLRLTAAAAVALGALGGLRRLRWPFGVLLGLLVGAVIVMAQITQLESLGGQPLFWDRFTDFWFRFEDWFRQAFNAGLTTDNLPFVFFTDVFVFVAAFFGAYILVRWRNAWPAMILLGALLAVNVSYLSDRQWNLSYGFFLTGAMLLLMRASLLRRMDRWTRQAASYPDWISLSFLGATMIAIVLLLTLSRALPRADQSDALEGAWDTIASPFDSLNDDFRRIFSGIDSRRGVPVHSFDDFKVLQGDIDPGDAIVLRAAATEPGLLRGSAYDRYTGRGWVQSPSTNTRVEELEPISGQAPDDDDPRGGLALPQSSYLQRRPVAAQISVERSPSVLFSFGVPIIANKDTRVDTLAPAEFTVDFVDTDDALYRGTDLEDAVNAIADRLDDDDPPSALEVASYVPPRYDLVDVIVEQTAASTGDDGDAGADGVPTAVVLRSTPEEADVLALRPTEERLRAGFTYQITGTVSSANEDVLRASGGNYPVWVRERFLQLPDSLEDADRERLGELVDTIAQRFGLTRDQDGAFNPYDIATAVELYLRSAPAVDEQGRIVRDDDGNVRPLYPLTTDIDLPPTEADAVIWFLFDNHDDDGLPVGGYYDYHASAAALLLRQAGVPARIVTGFVLGPNNFDERTENFIVRGHDAYTWLEVYFPDLGWVDFDPTPGASADEALASIAGGGVGAGGTRITAQRLATPRIDLRPGLGGETLGDLQLDDILQYLAQGVIEGAGPQETGLNRWYWLTPSIIAAVIAAATVLIFAAWRVSLRGLGPVEQAWVGASRLARWSGLPSGDATTAHEHARRIDAALATDGAALALADAYGAVRFGRKELDEDQGAAATDQARRLRRRLLPRLLRLRRSRPVAAAAEQPDVAPSDPNDSDAGE